MFGPIDSDEPHSNDAEYRAGTIVGHLGLPVQHAFYTPEGVGLFWSITRYSALTRNTIPGKNDLYKYHSHIQC